MSDYYIPGARVRHIASGDYGDITKRVSAGKFDVAWHTPAGAEYVTRCDMSDIALAGHLEVV